MRAESPQPVKYFIGALYSDAKLLEDAIALCWDQIGEVDLMGEPFPFTATHYYDDEMGTPIYRKFFSFKSLLDPGALGRLKNICNEIEDELSIDGKRRVNLDLGYLDLHKMVLASAKYNGQKIYVSDGIYADLTLVFENGDFHPVDNTFPDFKSGAYNPVFIEYRERLKQQLRALPIDQSE